MGATLGGSGSFWCRGEVRPDIIEKRIAAFSLLIQSLIRSLT